MSTEKEGITKPNIETLEKSVESFNKQISFRERLLESRLETTSGIEGVNSVLETKISRLKRRIEADLIKRQRLESQIAQENQRLITKALDYNKQKGDLDLKMSRLERFKGRSSAVSNLLSLLESQYGQLAALPRIDPEIQLGLNLIQQTQDKEEEKKQQEEDEYLQGVWRLSSDDGSKEIMVEGGYPLKTVFALMDGTDNNRLHDINSLTFAVTGVSTPENKRLTLIHLARADKLLHKIGSTVRKIKASGQPVRFRVEDLPASNKSYEEIGIMMPGFSALEMLVEDFKVDIDKILEQINANIPKNPKSKEEVVKVLEDTVNLLCMGDIAKTLTPKQLELWNKIKEKTGKILKRDIVRVYNERIEIWYESQKKRTNGERFPIEGSITFTPIPQAKETKPQEAAVVTPSKEVDRHQIRFLSKKLSGKLQFLASRGIKEDVTARVLSRAIKKLDKLTIQKGVETGILEYVDPKENGDWRDRKIKLRTIVQWLYLIDIFGKAEVAKQAIPEDRRKLLNIAFDRATAHIKNLRKEERKSSNTPEKTQAASPEEKGVVYPVGEIILTSDFRVEELTTWSEEDIDRFIQRSLTNTELKNPRLIEAVRQMIDQARRFPEGPNTNVLGSKNLRAIRPQHLEGGILTGREAFSTRLVYRVYEAKGEKRIKLEKIFYRDHEGYETYLKRG